MSDNTVMVAEAEEEYILTPWGCLTLVLSDYGIHINGISGKAGTHIVEDFMELMVRMGHAKKKSNSEQGEEA